MAGRVARRSGRPHMTVGAKVIRRIWGTPLVVLLWSALPVTGAEVVASRQVSCRVAREMGQVTASNMWNSLS
jgi:hypothetical protein